MTAPTTPYRLRWARAFLVGIATIAGFVLLAWIAVLVLTGTDWGRERVRIYAQGFFNGMVHGHVQIGRITGNLLQGLTAHDVSITDSAGAPFVVIESFTADYSIASLLRKHIWLNNVVAVKPLVVLDRPPKTDWNWQRIFRRTPTVPQPNAPPGWGDWVRLTNTTIVGGQLLVRTPWTPDTALSPAAADSVIRQTLGGGTRLMVRRVATGFQKIIELDSVNATLPLLRITDPGQPYRLAEFSTLRMNAYPFRAPGAVVRNLMGAFQFTNDSVWWNDAYAELPHSRASGRGRYVFADGDLDLTLHADPVQLTDLRWIYPRLPDGNGALDFRLQWIGGMQDYLAYNADVTLSGAQVRGSIGLTLSDTILVHGTNLRFTGLDTRTLEQLIPHFSSPRRGTLAGQVRARGGRNALLVDGDVTFDDQRAGTSRIAARGVVGFPKGGLHARDLHVAMEPVEVAMGRSWDPTLPIGGTVTGTIVVNGSTASALRVTGAVRHADEGQVSVLAGHANVELTGAKRVDVAVTASPVSLVELGKFFPAVGLQGAAAGPVRASGRLGDLSVTADLQLPENGRLATTATLDLASAEKSYDVTARLHTVNLRSVDAKAPVTSLTAQAAVRGRGLQLATMRTTVAADFSASTLDTIGVDTLSVRAALASGLASVQRLYASGSHVFARASGSFGLVRGRAGTLDYTVAVDSLGALNRWVPLSPGPHAPVPPRPAVVARAVARARADSARIDRATAMQRMITGAPGPVLSPTIPPPVPTDTISGAAFAKGTLRGNLYDFDLAGSAGGRNVIARGNFVRAFTATYAWTNARTSNAHLALAVDADSLSLMGFAFDTAVVRLTYASPGGHVSIITRQPGNREYAANGDYELHTTSKLLRLADMRFQLDTAAWALVRPTTIEWGGPGIRVTDFEMRNRGTGRVYVNGLLPTSGTEDFQVAIENLPAANVVDVLQSDASLTGTIDLSGAVRGTLSHPSFNGAAGLSQATYNGVAIPETHTTFGYADRELVAHAEALRTNGAAMTTVDAHLPIDLAFTGVTGSRLLPQPMAVDVVGDSLPLELVPEFTDLVSNLHGHAYGTVSMRGTLQRPVLVGAVGWQNGSVMINETGATIDDITASVHMARDTVFLDSLSGTAKGPVHLRGSLAVGSWREPAFNLYLTASGAELLNNDWGDLRVNAGVALTGPFRGAYLSGAATITQGVIYAPEPSGRHVIGQGDPALFNVLDTAVATDRVLFPPQSPLLANLRMDVLLNVQHDTWVRNREANVEIYTDDPLHIQMEQQALSLIGVVTTDRGEYNFMSKRFQIQRGSAMFIGSPDLNPTLQITGTYQVEVVSRGTLNISVEIGGTLRRPSLSLTSDAQPPKTESELLSLLAFGRTTSSLLAFTNSSITGSAASGDVFGAGAQYAVQRLASVALGVAVDQMEVEAGRAFGTDVLDITPGDNPLTGGTHAIGNLFTQSRIEAGKYTDPRTFLSVDEQASKFGATIDHRTADGWRFDASIEPRIILLEPRLNSQPFRTTQAYGGFVIREWRF